ncbi:hypothetical protein XIS1_1260018 [Xenorhabdus innexi]|uniref:Uncharacterized protein n=1 Tax=Xenorhabdus innexi TaxID=290109 RepID=A0A1N6MSF6_9GAMM|nr:hypothetical protein XIS1_1260018 [Xenorhabdus innexi]
MNVFFQETIHVLDKFVNYNMLNKYYLLVVNNKLIAFVFLIGF